MLVYFSHQTRIIMNTSQSQEPLTPSPWPSRWVARGLWMSWNYMHTISPSCTPLFMHAKQCHHKRVGNHRTVNLSHFSWVPWSFPWQVCMALRPASTSPVSIFPFVSNSFESFLTSPNKCTNVPIFLPSRGRVCVRGRNAVLLCYRKRRKVPVVWISQTSYPQDQLQASLQRGVDPAQPSKTWFYWWDWSWVTCTRSVFKSLITHLMRLPQ